LLMWRVIGPLITRYKGYLAWSKLGFGEDLPLGVYTQWKRWCRFPRYFFDDPQTQNLAAEFERVRTPIIAANSTDDLWALPQSRDAFVSGYKNAALERVDIDPKTLGMTSIGHMGYFRASAQPLWKRVIDWFESAPPRSI
jgi:predicted alpha/beta hydrolase